MATPYIGQIMMFAGTFTIQGWAQCNGQLMAIAENDALYSLIGTTYGGDGQTTFGLPDLRGRAPVHLSSASGYVQGQSGGVEGVQLTSNQIPGHAHVVTASTATGSQAGPGGGLLASGVPMYVSDTPNHTLNAASVQPAGSNLPHTNLQPLLAITFLISLFGIYPSQS